MMTLKQPAYIPGVCNIGPSERAKRRQIGIICLAIFIAALVFLLELHIAKYYRILLLFPAFGALIGFLQDRLHFCVGYGLSGLYNVLHSVGQAESVESQGMRSIDRRKSIQIIGLSLGLSVILVVVSLVIPL
jgi:hypothetical protein